MRTSTVNKTVFLVVLEGKLPVNELHCLVWPFVCQITYLLKCPVWPFTRVLF